MEYFADLLKIVLPAALVIYGMYLTLLSFLKREREKSIMNLKTQNSNTLLPIRLQAAERLCLLLERTSINNLVMRVNNGAFTARELQLALLNEVRDEFNHNLSQQIYFSEETWAAVKTAVEQVITTINSAAEKLTQETRGIDLAKLILQDSVSKEYDPTNLALRKVKEEIQMFF
jgi:hypothetical protein